MKGYWEILKNLAFFSQLGFLLVTPPVCMAILGWWLRSRFGLGLWVMLLCLAAGFLASASNGIRFYRKIMGDTKKKQSPSPPVTYNRHE